MNGKKIGPQWEYLVFLVCGSAFLIFMYPYVQSTSPQYRSVYFALLLYVLYAAWEGPKTVRLDPTGICLQWAGIRYRTIPWDAIVQFGAYEQYLGRSPVHCAVIAVLPGIPLYDKNQSQSHGWYHMKHPLRCVVVNCKHKDLDLFREYRNFDFEEIIGRPG